MSTKPKPKKTTPAEPTMPKPPEQITVQAPRRLVSGLLALLEARPAPSEAAPACAPLTEADVRRIAREEIAAFVSAEPPRRRRRDTAL